MLSDTLVLSMPVAFAMQCAVRENVRLVSATHSGICISGVKVSPFLLDDSSAILPLQHVPSGLVFPPEGEVS